MLNLFVFLVSLSNYIRTSAPSTLVLICMLLFGIDKSKRNLKIAVWFCIALALLYTFIEYIYVFENHILSNSLFYFGFIIPLVCIIKTKYKFNNIFFTKNLFIYICILIAIEALINNLVPKNLLNLVPVETEQTSFFGFYQRPMGFAGNASMTAGVMHMMWAIRQDMKIYFKFEYLFVGLSMIILASGFGIILFILQLLIYFNKLLTQVVLRSLFLTLPIVLFYIFNLNFDIIAYLSSGEVSDANKEAGFYKLDFSYIEFLIQLKTEQLTDNLSEVASLLIGNQHLMNIPQTSGDFGYYTIFSTVGFIGFLVLFLIPISYVKRIIYFPRSYIILFLSFLHYPGLLTPVGQLVLAFFYFNLIYFKNSKYTKY